MSHVLRCSGYTLVKTDIVRARDCYLYDERERRYVDFEAGVWCAALGYNHPRVNQAIRTQLERTAHIGYRYTSAVVENAARDVLNTLTLADGKCVFLSSGSEAVEFGVQVARGLTDQPLLLALSDSYLSAYGSAGTKRPDEWVSFEWHACADCDHAAGNPGDGYYDDGGHDDGYQMDECDPQCDRLREIPFSRIGGLVFEPGNASGLVRIPPTRLIRTLARVVKDNGGLVVVDEVTTGLGRTGAWYGFHHYGLQPDIIALGKGLGNGYPVSAVAMTQDVAGRLDGSAFHYAQSHQNDPLACVVAREVIAVIRDEGLVERSQIVGEGFVRDLRQLAERCAVVKEVRGRGLMVVMELERDHESISVTSAYRELLNQGFIVGCKPAANILRFYPPLTIGENEIAGLLGVMDVILSADP